MNQVLYRLHYFDAPVVKEKNENFLILESIRNKVWNPVFIIGVITFVLSMTLRGFFNQAYAVVPLGVSTLILFSGIWILSANAMVVFDKNQSSVYFIYKHLGYLQKIYSHPLTSIEQVEIISAGNGKLIVQLQKDDLTTIRVAEGKKSSQLPNTAAEIASFMNVPLKEK